MLDKKFFWVVQNLVLVAFWLAAIGSAILGNTRHWLVLVAAMVFVAHLLEVPLAFRLLRGRDASPLRVSLMTLLFGFTWWVPARRGIYTAL